MSTLLLRRQQSVQLKFVYSALGALLLACAVSAAAQDDVRVVRLSRVEGSVFVAHAGNDAWENAAANVPLQQGDTLATQSGLAEVEFENGATAFVAENSALDFTQLGFSGGGKVTQLRLTQGTGSFYANLTRQDSFRVSTSTFEVAIPERAEFRVDAFKDGASLEVLQGNVDATTAAGSTNLEKGQSVAIHQGDFQKLDIARLPSPDSFDQWVISEGEATRSGTKNTLSYVNSPNYYGLSDLSIYGNWVNFPGYGPCWRPYSVGRNWTPYVNGVWQLDARLGWIWVSAEPWGWAPYHFGSWMISPTVGWVWVPGGGAGLRQWEASRVNWMKVGDQVGWVAISPNDRPGAPANAVEGVVIRSKQPTAASRAVAANQIVAARELRAVTPTKPPTASFAVASPTPATAAVGPLSQPGISSPRVSSQAAQGIAPQRVTTQRLPEKITSNEGIVYDGSTRTFINRDGPATFSGPAMMARPVAGSEVPRASSAVASSLMKEHIVTSDRVPRPTVSPAGGPANVSINRVILPPSYSPPSNSVIGAVPNPASSSSANSMVNGAAAARSSLGVPNSVLHSIPATGASTQIPGRPAFQIPVQAPLQQPIPHVSPVIPAAPVPSYPQAPAAQPTAPGNASPSGTNGPAAGASHAAPSAQRRQ